MNTCSAVYVSEWSLAIYRRGITLRVQVNAWEPVDHLQVLGRMGAADAAPFCLSQSAVIRDGSCRPA
jgi:hypothetical protein